MSNYSVSITGLDDLIRRLDIAQPLYDGLRLASLEAATEIKRYPPKPEGSTYDRTMRLRNHWTYGVDEAEQAGFVGISLQAVPYAHYVQDRDNQTAVHQASGWQTAQGVLDEKRDKIPDIIAIPIRKHLDGK